MRRRILPFGPKGKWSSWTCLGLGNWYRSITWTTRAHSELHRFIGSVQISCDSRLWLGLACLLIKNCLTRSSTETSVKVIWRLLRRLSTVPTHCFDTSTANEAQFFRLKVANAIWKCALIIRAPTILCCFEFAFTTWIYNVDTLRSNCYGLFPWAHLRADFYCQINLQQKRYRTFIRNFVTLSKQKFWNNTFLSWFLFVITSQFIFSWYLDVSGRFCWQNINIDLKEENRTEHDSTEQFRISSAETQWENEIVSRVFFRLGIPSMHNLNCYDAVPRNLG